MSKLVKALVATATLALATSAAAATDLATLEVQSDIGQPTRTLHVESDGVVIGPDGQEVLRLGSTLLQALTRQAESVQPGPLVDLTPDQRPCPAHFATSFAVVTAAGRVEFARSDFNCHALLVQGATSDVTSLRDTLAAFLRLSSLTP